MRQNLGSATSRARDYADKNALDGKQDSDSDLTAIAALATTTFGRSLLTSADAAAARTAIGVGTGTGDASTNTSTSVDSEVAVFSGTTGKTIKRATGTGLMRLVSGVYSLVSRTIDGQAFDGSANITVIAPATHAATHKTTPVDADEFALVDSAASNTLARLTWADVKTALATWLTTLTATWANKTLTNPTITNYTESVVDNGVVTTTKTLDLTSGTVQVSTLTASTTCVFTMPTATAGKSFTHLVKQPATTGLGGVTHTGVKWPNNTAPAVTSGAGKADLFSFTCPIAGTWFGSVIQNYAY